MRRRSKIQHLWCFAILVIVLLTPTMATAQDQDPLRLIYINIGDHPARASFESIEDLLEQSPQIDLIPSREFLQLLEDYELGRELLSSPQRGDAEDEFAALLWELNVEGVLIHDVTDRRDRLELAVIGPRGWLMTEVDAPLDVGEIDQQSAVTVLQDIFGVLVPEVRGFRRDVNDGTLSAADFEMPVQQPPPTEPDDELDADLDDETDDPRAGTDFAPHELHRNVSARAGMLFGYRDMTMAQDSGSFAMRHSTALVGVAVRADGLVATFEDETMAIEVGGFFGFSPFNTIFGDEELGGQFMRVGGEGRFITTQVEEVTLRGIGGVETINLTLDQNQNYTGHGYMLGRLGGGITYHHEDIVTVDVNGLFMPILSASNSGGAYGDAAGWLGLGAEASAHLNLAQPFLVRLDYGFQYLDTEYPEPDPNVLSSPAQATDMIHHVMLSVGYRMGW